MPLREGEKFADFTVVRLLGSGGMGEVYLVKHPRLPRFEALKILPQEVSADAAFRERFHREAELAASLSHPHIVGVHDQGECDGQLWISMEFIDGSDSAQLLRHRYPGGFDRDEAIAIVTTIAGALDHAHNRGLLHRDVKPANILVGSGGTTDQRIMLADFGIARRINDISGLTATNIVVGTVTYAAPEQLMGSDIDGRADQYALAATAYELLCGEPPFKHPNPVVVIGHHLNSAPPRLGAANPELAGLDGALSRALAKERTARFGCCLEFAAALTTGSPSSPNASRASAPPQVTLPTMASQTLVPMYDQNTVMGPARPSRTPTAQPPSDQARKSVGAVTARKTVRKRTIMASALVTVALATISALGIIKLGHQNPVDTSQQDRVRATVNKFDAAVRSGDLAILRDVTCGAAHDGYMRYDDQAWSQAYSRVAEMKQYPVIASIDKVVVNGQHAEANVTTFMAYDPQLRSTRSLDLQYRDDQWKICQSPSG